MFRWDSDTGSFKLNEVRFHLDTVDDIDFGSYRFDFDSHFNGVDAKYTVDSILIWKAAIRIRNSYTDHWLKRRRHLAREYYKNSGGSMHKVSKAIKEGKIKKHSKCVICNTTEDLCAHHEDYSRPLDVVWLCRKCHGKLHTGAILVNEPS